MDRRSTCVPSWQAATTQKPSSRPGGSVQDRGEQAGEALLQFGTQRNVVPIGQHGGDPQPGTADEAAQLITFLVSPAASYLTGSQFTVDGGLLPTV